MYIYIYIYIEIYRYVIHIHICMLINLLTYIYIYIYIFVHVYKNISKGKQNERLYCWRQQSLLILLIPKIESRYVCVCMFSFMFVCIHKRRELGKNTQFSCAGAQWERGSLHVFTGTLTCVYACVISWVVCAVYVCMAGCTFMCAPSLSLYPFPSFSLSLFI